MTQDQINTLKEASAEAHSRIRERHRRELAQAEETWARLARACDHKYHDGSSAVEGGFFCCTCKLCGDNDM
jgi:hypothetical protein